MVLFLNDSDVASLVSMDEALTSVRAALVAQADGQGVNAPRQRVGLPGARLRVAGGVFAAARGEPGVPGQVGWMGAKLSVSAGDRRRGWMFLFDRDANLRCILSANRMGQLRTGAATGVSVDLLASAEATVMASLGSGYQAWTQVEAVVRVRTLDRVLVWSRTPERAEDFARRVTTTFGVAAQAVPTAADAVRTATIVTTMTTTTNPILSGKDVAPGTHVVLGGSNNPQHREADAELFRRADCVYVDDLGQAREESGDLRLAVDEGAVRWDEVHGLAQAVAMAAGSRRGPDEAITVFCSQGMGLFDVSLAAEVFVRAEERGIGTPLPIDGAPLSPALLQPGNPGNG